MAIYFSGVLFKWGFFKLYLVWRNCLHPKQVIIGHQALSGCASVQFVGGSRWSGKSPYRPTPAACPRSGQCPNAKTEYLLTSPVDSGAAHFAPSKTFALILRARTILPLGRRSSSSEGRWLGPQPRIGWDRRRLRAS